MSESVNDRNIDIKESSVGSAIASGDGNTIYVIQQTTAQNRVEPAPAKDPDIGPNPYKGLAAFTESDTAYYFGREVQVKRLWQRFQSLYEQSEVPRFLPVLGPSGCGKSSLLRAGFIPELARNPLPGKDQMRVAVLVPGARPLTALAGVLAKAVTNDPFPLAKAEAFEQALKKPNEVGECDGLCRIVNLIPDIRDTPLVILVDQFEEVYALCQDAEHRRVFIDNLLHVASDPTGKVSVVITLRSDFWEETQRYKQLNQVIGSDYVVTVPAMTATELRRAIAEPAKQAGHPLDEAIIELLIKETELRKGALPLLQFSLSRIWDELGEGKTPETTYREMGGVGGALAGKAQETYDRLSDSDKNIARRVFVGLVQLGEGTRDTRRRVRIDDLIAQGETLEKVQKVIHQFSSFRTRLLTLSSDDGHKIAEVTHEALFESWQQLNDWLETSRSDTQFQRRLGTVAQYWDEQGRAEELLWRSPDLDLLRSYQVRESHNMTAIETAFWRASARAEQRRKLTRRLVTGGLALGFGWTAISASIATGKVRAANRNNVKVLAQSAATLNASGDRFQATMMALRAAKQFHKSRISDPALLGQINREMFSAFFASGRTRNWLIGHSSEVWEVRFSPDGQTLATASFDGTAKVWTREGTLLTTLAGHRDVVSDVRFSPDGQSLATTSLDGTSKVWTREGTLLTTFAGHRDAVRKVRFSPDGQSLATASRDGTARVWRPDGTLLTTLDGHSNEVREVRFSPDGQTLATASRDGMAKVWTREGKLLTMLAGHRDEVSDVHFSPDGQILATASFDGTAKVWRPDGTLLTTLAGHRDEVSDVRFSPDGQILATASRDGTAKVWRRDGELLTTLDGHSAAVWDVQFSPDDQTLATASSDGTAKVWRRDGTLLTTLAGHRSSVIDVRFSPDGKTLATASDDDTAKVWRRDGTLLATLAGHSYGVLDVQFSPDGQTLATASSDGTARVWTRHGTRVARLDGHGAEVVAIQFSPDGKTLATASRDGTARVWTRDGSLVTMLAGHRAEVSGVRFSPDGKTLATASSDGTVKVWNSDGSLALIELHPCHQMKVYLQQGPFVAPEDRTLCD